jgi:hypothetical protein
MNNQPNKITLRWTYIGLPLVFFVLTLITAGIFYAKLPQDIAYHFQGSTPDRWITRGAFICWMVIPHVFFILLSIFLTRMLMLGGKYVAEGESPLPVLLPLMGNMIALPQIVMFTAFLQLIFYNGYDAGIAPLWLPAVIILILGAIVLGFVFAHLMRKFRKKKS